MARDIQLAVAAAELAVADAGLVDGGVDPTRFGVDLGAGLISTELDELAPAISQASDGDRRRSTIASGAARAIAEIPPIWLLKYLPNMLACHISILLDCQGPSNTITEAEAASNLAIGEASRIIARGRADVMITGGADSKIHPLSLIRMSLLDQMSRWQRRAGPGLPAVRPPPRRLGRRRGGGHPDPRGTRARPGAAGPASTARSSASARAATPRPAGGLDPDGIGTEIAMRAALRDAGLAPGGHRPRQRPRRRPRSCPTWPRRGPSTASSAPAARSPSRR